MCQYGVSKAMLIYTCCKHHFNTWVLAGKNYSLLLKIITIVLAMSITSEYSQCTFLDILHHQRIIVGSCPASPCRKKKKQKKLVKDNTRQEGFP